jgi:hypothetical protein
MTHEWEEQEMSKLRLKVVAEALRKRIQKMGEQCKSGSPESAFEVVR